MKFHDWDRPIAIEDLDGDVFDAFRSLTCSIVRLTADRVPSARCHHLMNWLKLYPDDGCSIDYSAEPYFIARRIMGLILKRGFRYLHIRIQWMMNCLRSHNKDIPTEVRVTLETFLRENPIP